MYGQLVSGWVKGVLVLELWPVDFPLNTRASTSKRPLHTLWHPRVSAFCYPWRNQRLTGMLPSGRSLLHQRPKHEDDGQSQPALGCPVAAAQFPDLDEEFARVRFRGEDARPSHRTGHSDQQCQPVLGNLLGIPRLFHEATLVLTLEDDDLVKLFAL